MPKFAYKAKKGPKEVVTDIIEASSKEAAISKLAESGYVPISINEYSKEEKSKKRVEYFPISKKVSSRDITIFTSQLASLLRSKVPLLEAITLLFNQVTKLSLKEVISFFEKEIKDGKNLSDSLARFPRIFSPLYVSMVRAGESGGVLEETLTRLSEFREKEEEVRAKIISSLVYPLFIVIVGLGTIFVLITFVIPHLTQLFDQIGQDLPLPTKLLTILSENFKKYWIAFVGAIAILFFAVKKRGLRGQEALLLDRLKLKIPVYSDFIKKSILARFSRTLRLLLANGIPLFKAIEIATPAVGNEVYRRELEKIHKDIVDGLSVEKSLKKSAWFPQFMVNMIAVGEKGGNLDESLDEIANFFDREVDKALRIVVSLIEPAIILVMGLTVGFVVFAMMMPIFEMNLSIR